MFANRSLMPYAVFLQKIDKQSDVTMNSKQLRVLGFLTKEIGDGKRIEDVIVLHQLLSSKGFISFISFDDVMERETLKSVIRIMTHQFQTETEARKFSDLNILSVNDNGLSLHEDFKHLLSETEFKTHFMDLLNYVTYRYETEYKDRNPLTKMVLNKRYTRRDVCRLFNWDKDVKGTIYGYLVRDNTMPVFVTYHKSDDIDESISYDDRFISEQYIICESKNNRTMESNEIKAIQDAERSGLRISLFVKKEDGESGEFYYLGEMTPEQLTPRMMKTEKKELPIVEILYKLHTPVREDIYRYITEEMN